MGHCWLSKDNIELKFFVYLQLNVKTVLFQLFQFGSIWPIDRTLLGTITLVQSRLRSDGNWEVFFIPQSSSITGASPQDGLMPYYPNTRWMCLTPLQGFSRCIRQPQPTRHCYIVVCEFELQSRYYIHFQTNILGENENSFIPQVYINYYHCCSIKMALALNNPRRMVCH